MSTFMLVPTPAGQIPVEMDTDLQNDGRILASIPDLSKSFEQAVESLKKNAEYIKTQLIILSPDEVEISFGIKAGAEAGTPLWGLAKATGEASYTVTMKWKSNDAAKALKEGKS